MSMNVSPANLPTPLNFTSSVFRVVTGSYTLLTSDGYVVFLVSAPATATLPAASTVAPGTQKTVSNASASTANVTLASAGGTFPATILSPGNGASFVSDGTNWQNGDVVFNTSSSIAYSTATTVPPTSATIQTALGNLALGVAYHNTLAYDVRLTVYLAVSADTTLTVSDGVGPTNTPAQTAIITTTVQIGIIPISCKIPAGQWRLLSVAGTQTSAICGQYLEAA
jgi:hypothetical protein